MTNGHCNDAVTNRGHGMHTRVEHGRPHSGVDRWLCQREEMNGAGSACCLFLGIRDEAARVIGRGRLRVVADGTLEPMLRRNGVRTRNGICLGVGL